MENKRFVIGIFVLLAACSFTVIITAAHVTELNVTPEVVVQGETLSLYGIASPSEGVWLNGSFVTPLPVSNGTYLGEFNGIHFPGREKAFRVTAEDVKDIRISLGPILSLPTIEYPLEGPLQATNNTASISVAFPLTVTWSNLTLTITIGSTQPRDVRVYGHAADGAECVNLSVDLAVKVVADSNGTFNLDVETEGVPLGEFFITTDGLEKIVEVVSSVPTANTSI
jgi:hypothetical protein